MSNSDYNNALSQFYTRHKPVLSFIKALYFHNNIRWTNLTRNIEFSLKSNIEKIQQNIDLKNVLLILNLLPNLQNEQNVNLDYLFSNLAFGGTISYYNWIEISDNLSYSAFLSKTVFLAPRIHNFLFSLQNNYDSNNLNLLALKTVSEITFKENFENLYIETVELLAFDINIYLLRYLIRFKHLLEDYDHFQKIKNILSPWKNVKTFIGNPIFNYQLYDNEILFIILDRLYTLSQKFGLNISQRHRDEKEKLTNDDFNNLETSIFRAKVLYLKRHSISENKIAKVLLVLTQLMLEIENLSVIIFGKTYGLDNDIISEKIFSL